MKRLIFVAMLLFGLVSNMNAQEKGDFYVGGSLGFAFGANGLSLTDGYEPIDSAVASVATDFQLNCGYFVANKIKIGAVLQRNRALSENSDIESSLSLTSIGGSIAYYGEIVDGLYYVPELVGSLVLSGSYYEDDWYFPLSGMSAMLSIIQLEFKPTQHFSTSVNLGYIGLTAVGGSSVYYDSILDLFIANFDTVIGLNPTVTFKYYF